MKFQRRFACMLVTLFMTGCSHDPKPGTAEAVAVGDSYMRSMSDTLANAKAFTFATREHLEILAPGDEKKVLSFTRKVTVRRPNALFFELDGTGDGAPEIAAYYDGHAVTLSQGSNGKWTQVAAPANLDDMLDYVAQRFGLPVPIGDVVYSSPYDAFIGKGTNGGFVGRETLDGVPCVKLDYADAYVETRLWIPASGPGLPRRLEILYKKSPTPTPLISQINFTDWKLGASVTDATFTFKPSADGASIDMGDFVAGMRAGTIALGHGLSPSATSAAK